MSTLRNVFGVCVSDRSTEGVKQEKLRFGVPLTIALKSGNLPVPLVDLLAYIADRGVTTVDIFRRAGNPTDAQRIMKRMAEGKSVIFSDYNFYTLSSVVKKFLLKIPGGVMGADGEDELLSILGLKNDMEQYDAIHKFLETLSHTHRRLLSLLFGTWFRIISNSQVNCMTCEALAISVAGSIFHTCSDDPVKIDKAGRVIQLLIKNYGPASLLDSSGRCDTLIDTTLASETDTSLQETLDDTALDASMNEKEEAIVMELEESQDDIKSNLTSTVTSGSISEGASITNHPFVLNMSIASAPTVSALPSPDTLKRARSVEDELNDTTVYSNQTNSLSRFNSVKRRQLERLRQRSDWFLGPEWTDLSPKSGGIVGGGNRSFRRANFISATLPRRSKETTRHSRPVPMPSILNSSMDFADLVVRRDHDGSGLSGSDTRLVNYGNDVDKSCVELSVCESNDHSSAHDTSMDVTSTSPTNSHPQHSDLSSHLPLES